MFKELFGNAQSHIIPLVREIRVDRLPIHSASPGYDFRLSCLVYYQQTRPGAEPHPATHEVARHAVAQQAAGVAAGVQLPDYMALQTQLAAMLGTARLELNGLLRVWAVEVVALPDEADLKAVQRQRELERDLLVWQHQKEMERRERDFVAEMLREPERAVAWWLSRNPQHVAQALDMVEPLRQLSSTIHGRPATAPAATSPEDRLLAASEQLFGPLDEWNRALLGDQLAKTLDTFGHAELAARLRDRLDAPGLVV
ncbi:hypothetical protein [Kutzneria sp. 744]|uniref:hypothetical protein n=1 Tax=Kutzneria sp. (strain 744) TaxID=345341 RepID=UPI0003EECCC3|nr:hypothetical protein [Kutzneria sp. 744]EWM16378.1 LigA protein [Kutzneria sp. 744]